MENKTIIIIILTFLMFSLMPKKVLAYEEITLNPTDVSSSSIVLNRPNLYDYAPSIMYINGKYKMWWCGNTIQNDFTDHIWYSTSTDFVNWSTPIPVLQTIGTPVQGYFSCDPTVVKATNDIYYMYFTSELSHVGGGTDNQVYLATSTNGTEWIHYNDGNPIIPLRSSSPRNIGNYGIGMSSVIFNNGKFIQFYIDATLDSNLAKTVASFSTDGGITFQKINNGVPVVKLFGSPDFKYLPNAKKYIAIGGHNSKYELEIYLFSEDFQILKRITIPISAFSQSCTSNAGILGDRFGNVVSEDKMTIIYASGSVNATGDCYNPQSWDLYKSEINLTSILNTSSPSLPGDLNGDSKVDLYDYNLLISNFGNPYTIFDYNLLVSNYGK